MASSSPDRIRWQYSGRIVQRTSSTYTVEIDWQRDGGSFTVAPKTTQQVVMQLGVPQVLDTLTPPSTNACGTTSLRFEAAVVPFSWIASVAYGGFGVGGAGGRGRGVGAAAGGGGFGGPGTATGGGARGRGMSGSGVNGAGASANAGGGGAGSDFSSAFSLRGGSALEIARQLAGGNYVWNYAGTRGPINSTNATVGGGRGVGVGPIWMDRDRLTPITTGSYDAELWLVHTPTGGSEETQHLAVHFGADGDAAEFPAVTLSGPNGPTTVDVAVSLRVMADEHGANVLRVIIVRRLDTGSSMSASTGATTKVVPLPAANDTLSFELPDTRGFSINSLEGHKFSVRLRMGK